MNNKIVGIVASSALVALASVAQAGTIFVANSGFETGDFTGWTGFGNTTFNGVDGNAHSGVSAAFFGPIGSIGGIQQNLTTAAGVNYLVSFWLDPDGGTPSEFELRANGNLILSLLSLPDAPYTQYSAKFTATGAVTTLSFGFRNDPGFTFLDDVEVSSVPLPPAAWSGIAMLAGLAAFSWGKRRRALTSL